ncbi:DUF4150 domain-containing protein [Caballeronia ptereochthonis]|uniref:PF13665 domain protein n=1 Tax=Caballeronia ptereochthonis TaxID=1777144 RepID=A0A157ZZA4_9BURK|nr:DUF4150 domain-containing protein [Caballeronia ptereochthonis]SAK50766.1 PF13665 domain protein [Caballeronia ptereochthonis]
MANQVFANGNEVSCKAAQGKSIACTPDVCMTPPENPATPPGVPVPYPNTAMAGDTSDGSSSVVISSQEVMLKNKSYFKKSTGDEAGSAAKKGVVTSVNTGKAYFIVWSMDVKVEGENVVRHGDLTTHNHASTIFNGGTVTYLDEMTRDEMPEGCRKAEAAQRAAERALSPSAKAKESRVTAGGYFESSGTNMSMMAASNVSRSMIKRSPYKYEGFEGGISSGGRSRVTCGGKKHQYRREPYSPPYCDAEAKIIEGLFRKTGGSPSGTLYLKVVGLPVCCDCQKLIACAGEHIKIKVCPPAAREECE